MALAVTGPVFPLKGQHTCLSLLASGGLGPREARQDKTVPQCLVIWEAVAAFSKESGAGDRDVLCQRIWAAAMGACTDPQGLHSEGTETGVYHSGPNVSHGDGGVFHAHVGKQHHLGVFQCLLEGLSCLA